MTINDESVTESRRALARALETAQGTWTEEVDRLALAFSCAMLKAGVSGDEAYQALMDAGVSARGAKALQKMAVSQVGIPWPPNEAVMETAKGRRPSQPRMLVGIPGLSPAKMGFLRLAVFYLVLLSILALFVDHPSARMKAVLFAAALGSVVWTFAFHRGNPYGLRWFQWIWSMPIAVIVVLLGVPSNPFRSTPSGLEAALVLLLLVAIPLTIMVSVITWGRQVRQAFGMYCTTCKSYRIRLISFSPFGRQKVRCRKCGCEWLCPPDRVVETAGITSGLVQQNKDRKWPTNHRMAIVGFVLGIAGSAAFFSIYFLVVPLAGLAISLMAMRGLRQSQGVMTGRRLAFAGILICAAVTVTSGTLYSYQVFSRLQEKQALTRQAYEIIDEILAGKYQAETERMPESFREQAFALQYVREKYALKVAGAPLGRSVGLVQVLGSEDGERRALVDAYVDMPQGRLKICLYFQEEGLGRWQLQSLSAGYD